MMPRRFLTLACLLIVAGTSVGCQTGHLREVNEDLFSENQELRAQLERARAALDAAEADREELIAEVRRLEEELAAAPEPMQHDTGHFEGIEGIEVESSAGGSVTVRVPGDVLFAPGKVELQQASKKTLAEVAAVLQREFSGQSIRVEGYTDSDPIRRSDWKDNLELSLQRAAAVHRFLQEQGVEADRMYAAGFGPARPRETKEKSRRVEIVVVKER